MKLNNPYSLDGYFRPYWSEWDAGAVKHLDPLSDLAGCLEPRFYRAPNVGNDHLPPFGYYPYALTLLPGSYILGFQHAPSVYSNQAELELLTGTGDGLLFTAVATGTSGNAVSVNIPPVAAPNQVLAVNVAGNAITITPASDAAGNLTSTNAQVVAAIVGSVSASALVTVQVINNPGSLNPVTPAALFLQGGGLLTQETNYLVQITDEQLDHKFFSDAIRDDYLAGRPTLLETPYPVVAPGNFKVEFWNASQQLPCYIQLIFIVLEPVKHDLLNNPVLVN